MAVPVVMIIAAANGAIDLAIKLFKASKDLPDANSPEAQAELKLLEGRLIQTLADVKAYQPKVVP
jgi:hypothetical protein